MNKLGLIIPMISCEKFLHCLKGEIPRNVEYGNNNYENTNFIISLSDNYAWLYFSKIFCLFFSLMDCCHVTFFFHHSRIISIVKDIKASACKNAEQKKANSKLENIKPSVTTPQTKSQSNRIDFSTQVMGTLPLQGERNPFV